MTDLSVGPATPALTSEETRRLEHYRALIDEGWVADEVGYWSEEGAPEEGLALWSTWLRARAAADDLTLATKVAWGMTGKGGGWIVVATFLGPNGETFEPTPPFQSRERELESRKLTFALGEALGPRLGAARRRVARDLVNWADAAAITDLLERDGNWTCGFPYDEALLDVVDELAGERGFRVEGYSEDTHSCFFARWPRTADQE